MEVLRHKKKDTISNVYDLLLHLFILSAPIIVYGAFMFGVSWRLSRIIIVLISPFLLLKIRGNVKKILQDKFLVFGVIPFLVFTSFSMLWTPEQRVLFGYNRLAILYEVMFVYLMFLAADLSQVRLLSFAKSYLLSAIFPILIGGWQIANNIFNFSTAELPFQGLLITGKYEVFKNRHIFIVDEGYSRLTSCFAEPTIFGSFLGSVLLLSLLVEIKNKRGLIILRLFQALVLLCLLLSLSKLAILTLLIGLIIVFRNEKKYLKKLLTGLLVFFILSYSLMFLFTDNDYILRRLFTDSGHLTLVKKTFEQLKHINLFLGAGIGSIPGFSTNKFLLSRLYEGGFVGVLFALYVSFLPLKLFFQKIENLKMKNVCLALFVSTILGFHIYDDFLYIWPWIIIGMIMSYSCHSKEL